MTKQHLPPRYTKKIQGINTTGLEADFNWGPDRIKRGKSDKDGRKGKGSGNGPKKGKGMGEEG